MSVSKKPESIVMGRALDFSFKWCDGLFIISNTSCLGIKA